jgi:3-hydroxyisobutyrate dehydrogenase
MRLAFLGTGLMGRPMAGRLIREGHELAVYNRTREKVEPLRQAGAMVAESAKAAIESAPCSILMLTDAGAIQGLLFPAGSEHPDLRNRSIIQMGTISSQQSILLHEQVAAAEGEYLEAPVLGSVPQAEEGLLVVMVGGEESRYTRWAGLLKVFSRQPLYVGAVGKASALKLALNQLIVTETAAFSYSLGLVRRCGIDVDLFMSILRESAMFAPQFEKKLPRLLARDFSAPHFPAKHMLKDVDLMIAEGGATGLNTTVLESVRSIIENALSQGLSDQDYSALYSAVDRPDH